MSLLQRIASRWLFWFLVLCVAYSPDASGQSGPVSQSDVRRLMNRTEVKFIENRGQIIDNLGSVRHDILFKTSTGGVELYFSRNRVSYLFTKIDGDLDAFLRADCRTPHLEGDHEHPHVEGVERPTISRYRMDLELIDANPMVVVTPEDRTSEYTNYYIGHCPKGITDVRSYRRLVYRNVYPNIDLVINGAESGAKCDFVVHPGGRVEDIKLRYVAADNVEITADGSMRAVNALGYVEESAPYTYQGIASREIPSRYLLRDGVISFAVGEYDRFRPLIIDPTQLWATYFGGTARENLNGGDPSEVDRNGNIYITGHTLSTTFIASPGAYDVTNNGPFGFGLGDAFLAKFNADGDRIWATYYGGNGDELAHGVATDGDGNVFIAGHTEGSATAGFPILNAHQPAHGGNRDAFVAKFGGEGNLLWSTYLGGSQFDDGYALASDDSGNVIMVATTISPGLGTPGAFSPAKPGGGSYDLLVTKFNSTGVRQWATYYGGSQVEYGYGAASDNKNNILITGWTYSNDFPIQNAAQGLRSGGADAFVVKLTGAGNRLWATYYGGPANENDDAATIGYCGITTDPAGNVIIGGFTGAGFPNTIGPGFGGGTTDAFIAKFDTLGVRQWATYAGGTGNDIATNVATNFNGSVLITGFTNSVTGFPVTFAPAAQPAYQVGFGGVQDAFIAKYTATGTQVWGTYFGGPGDDRGEGLSVDPYGSIIIAGHTASNAPGDRPFAVKGPRQAAIHQPAIGGSDDAFISVFCDPEPPAIDSGESTIIPTGGSVILRIARGYRNVQWYRVGTPDVQLGIKESITVRERGRYFVKVENAGGCESISDTITVTEFGVASITGRGAPGSTRLISIAPNPSSSATTLRFELHEPGDVSVTLSDMRGSTVRTLPSGHYERGSHTITIDTRDLPQGFYLLQMQANESRMVERIEIAR